MSFRNRRRRTSYFLADRKERKDDLLELIKKNPEVGLTRLRGVFSQQTGNLFKTIDTYLSELVDAGLVEFDLTGIEIMVYPVGYKKNEVEKDTERDK